jgi:ABC-type multidrug transport system fused ATPase/permease subunit
MILQKARNNNLLRLYNRSDKSLRQRFISNLCLSLFAAIIEASTVFAIYPLMIQVFGSGTLNNSQDLGINTFRNGIYNDFYLVFIVIILLAAACFRLYAMKTNYNFASALTSNISANIYESIFSKNYNEYREMPDSYYISIMTRELSNFTSVINYYLGLFGNSFFILVSTGALLYINFSITMSSAILLLLIYIIIYRYTRTMVSAIGKECLVSSERYINHIQSSLGLWKTIVSSGSIHYLTTKLFKFDDSMRSKYASSTFCATSPKIVLETVIICALFVAMTKLSDLLLIDIATITTLLIALMRLVPSFQSIFALLTAIKTNQSSIDQLLLLVDRPIKQYQYNTVNYSTQELSNMRPGPIEWQNLTIQSLEFSYPDGRCKLFCKKLNLRPSRIYGLFAPSGSGKSTLLNLITGYIQPSFGDIKVDNASIYSNSLIGDWHKSIAYVGENPVFFNDTIAANISLSNGHSYNMDEIRNAARIACIDDYIMALPNMYATVMSNAYNIFSNGQRQRISIARALYQKPSLLILDEATTGIDRHTEQKIIHNMQPCLKCLCVVIVSHSHTLLDDCDHLITINGLGNISLS